MKICIQTYGIIDVFGAKEGCKILKEYGFEGVDWGFGEVLKSRDVKIGNYKGSIFEKELPEILEYYQDFVEELQKNGIEIRQAHAPFPAYVFEYGEQMLDDMIEIYKKCILVCDKFGCKNLVVHGVSLHELETRIDMEEIDRINDKLYTSLIPTLQNTNVTVCLENLFTTTATVKKQIYLENGHCSNALEAVELIDRLNALAGKECFGFCLDVGHLQLSKQDIRKYTKTLGKRIKALHIHDNDGMVDLHLAPYTGTVNWQNFYHALKDIGYDGDLNFETYRQIELPLCDKEMIKPWLQLIASCGRFFRDKISK